MFGLTTIISGALKIANWGAEYLQRKQDIEAEKYKADVGAATTLGTEALRVEAARNEAWGRVAVQAMLHPMWWVAWGLFVLPVGFYDGMIFFVSTFDRWLNTPGCSIPEIGHGVTRGLQLCEWWVRKVPPDQAALRASVIYFIFGAQATSGAAAGIGQVVSRWLARK